MYFIASNVLTLALFLPFYIEIGFHCAWIAQVSQNPTCSICFAMKKYHYSSLYAFC